MSFFSSVHDSHQYLSNTNWYRIALVVFAACVAISCGVGITITDQQAFDKSAKQVDQNYVVFTKWQSSLSAVFTRAAYMATTLATAADSFATIPMNLSAPAADRRALCANHQMINPTSFDQLAKDLFVDTPGIFQASYICHGIVNQMHPVDPFGVGLDMAIVPTTVYATDIFSLIDGKERMEEGPEYVDALGGYTIIIHHPIYTNVSSKSRENFWGSAMVMFRMKDILEGANIQMLTEEDGMESYVWVEAAGQPDAALYSSTEDLSIRQAIKQDGLMMRIPAGEDDLDAYIAMLPVGGLLPTKSTAGTIVYVVVIGVVVSIGVTLLFIVLLFLSFRFRHRRAPARGAVVYSAVLSLRGAQPIVDRAPLESARMFAEFVELVKIYASRAGCYVVCKVGERSVYVVADSPRPITDLCEDSVLNMIVRGCVENNGEEGGGGNGNGNDLKNNNINKQHNHHTASVTRDANDTQNDNDDTDTATERTPKNTATKSPQHLRRHHSHQSRSSAFSPASSAILSNTIRSSSRISHTRGGGGGAGHSTTDNNTTTDHPTVSSFIGTAVCRVTTACHAGPSPRIYDPIADVYFFGTSSVLAKLCAAADVTEPGEIAWTEAFSEYVRASDDSNVLADVEGRAMGSHSVEEKGETTLVATLVKCHDEDDRSDEDPSIALALLIDAYIVRMIAEQARHDTDRKADRRHHGGKKNASGGKRSGGGSSGASADAASVSRNATILHILIGGSAHLALDIVRRLVAEERGAVVSAHNSTIVCAFNLISAGGHHQVRAADTVMKLRHMLTVPFVCSIHHGKINALIADGGLVMCSGLPVAIGHALLRRAVSLGAAVHEEPSFNMDAVGEYCCIPQDVSGLCLLICHDELKAVFDCEAVDICNFTPQTSSSNDDAPLQKISETNAPQQQVQSTSSAVNGSSSLSVVYRLVRSRIGGGKLGGKGAMSPADEEWMYQVKDDEDLSPYAAVANMFNRIARGDVSGAKDQYEASLANNNENNNMTQLPTLQTNTASNKISQKDGELSGMSVYAKYNLLRQF